VQANQDIHLSVQLRRAGVFDNDHAVLASRTVQVKEGDVQDVLFDLAVGEIRGTVIDPDGRPMAHTQIQFQRHGGDEGWSWLSTTSDADGLFHLSQAPAGNYQPEVDIPGHAMKPAPQIVVRAGEPTVGVRIELVTAVKVSGTLVFPKPPGDAKLQWVWLQFTPKAGGHTIGIPVDDETLEFSSDQLTTTTYTAHLHTWPQLEHGYRPTELRVVGDTRDVALHFEANPPPPKTQPAAGGDGK
jgi:hypothetical protein